MKLFRELFSLVATLILILGAGLAVYFLWYKKHDQNNDTPDNHVNEDNAETDALNYAKENNTFIYYRDLKNYYFEPNNIHVLSSNKEEDGSYVVNLSGGNPLPENGGDTTNFPQGLKLNLTVGVTKDETFELSGWSANAFPFGGVGKITSTTGSDEEPSATTPLYAALNYENSSKKHTLGSFNALRGSISHVFYRTFNNGIFNDGFDVVFQNDLAFTNFSTAKKDDDLYTSFGIPIVPIIKGTSFQWLYLYSRPDYSNIICFRIGNSSTLATNTKFFNCYYDPARSPGGKNTLQGYFQY